MKRPFTSITKCEGESADSTSTAAISNQAFVEENTSAFPSYYNESSNDANENNNNGSASDSEDGLSESSKRMRRKRNAYQKISDEIRINLLDAVKNGETLKSAAKRHKINYSSAKSILHTYRKEGRILKKSAQERITKKKPSGGSETNKNTSKSIKSSKSSKKENGFTDENDYEKPKSLEVITKKVKTTSISNNSHNNEVQPLMQTDKNKGNMSKDSQHQENPVKTVPTITVHKGDEITGKLFGNDHDHVHDHYGGGFNSRPNSRRGSMHQFKMFEGFQNSYNDADFNHMLGDNYDFMGYRRFSQDFPSFNEMAHIFHAKPTPNDDHSNDTNLFFNSKINQHHPEDHKQNKVENLLDCDDHGRAMIDSQRMFRNNLRKASFLSFGSNTGFRKGSFDLY